MWAPYPPHCRSTEADDNKDAQDGDELEISEDEDIDDTEEDDAAALLGAGDDALAEPGGKAGYVEPCAVRIRRATARG